MAEVDIKNSQPYLLATLYPDASRPEARHYRQLATDGVIYEELMRINGVASSARAWGKTEFYKVIFGDCYVRESSALWPGMQREFPILAAVVEGHAGNALALALQRIEADIMIAKVVPALADALPGVPFLTIHDSVALPSAFAGKAREVIEACCIDATGGLRPAIETTLPVK